MLLNVRRRVRDDKMLGDMVVVVRNFKMASADTRRKSRPGSASMLKETPDLGNIAETPQCKRQERLANVLAEERSTKGLRKTQVSPQSHNRSIVLRVLQ